ncbi:MAG: WYL domain-containing protein [Clostridia bacterium]|nr:WYL domain-containing protein [Clostridia bacterium]
MPKSSYQKLKLLYLKQILETETDDNHKLSTKQLIDKLDSYGIKAERKSLYDDIECLIKFGVDVIVEKTDSNYYSIGEREFELPELKLLVDSVQSSKFLTVKKSNSLIKKLESLCSKNLAESLQRQVYIADRIKNMNESIYKIIDDIQTAINSHKMIEFKYIKYSVSDKNVFKKDGAVYKISPYALMLSEQYYYLLGYDSEDKIFKHYRVDKIFNIRITDENSDGEKEFENIDLAKYEKRFFSMFGGKIEKIKLLVDNDLIGVIIDKFGKNNIIMKIDENHFQIIVDIAVSPQFFGWLTSFSGKIKVLSPKSVKDDFLEHLINVQNNL